MEMKTESAGIMHELRRGMATLLTVGAIAGAGFGGGYVVGQRSTEPPAVAHALSGTPVANGYLNVPDEYSPEVRLNSEGAREAVLVHTSGLELKLGTALPRLLSSYERDPATMEAAMEEARGAQYKLVD